MPSGKPYHGCSPKLALAFDIGMTYTRISYSILNPGEVPTILHVSRYPAQGHVGGYDKVPSILYYDPQGSVRAVSAEVLQEHIIEQAEDEEWLKLEWWKLHLRTKDLASSHVKDEDLPPLPPGISAVQVLADYMRYLFSCARFYIVESHSGGTSMWNSLENNIEFILTYPDGWGAPQQQQFRRAAEIAGLIPSSYEHAPRIHLLTEGEAMARFCIDTLVLKSFSEPIITDAKDLQEDADEWTEREGVVVIDAGDGLVNLHAYSVRLSPQKEFKEVAPTECHFQGFVFVTQRAHTFLKAKLANSRYGSPEDIQQMRYIFDKTTKLRFRDANDPQYIRFGTVCDRDPQYDIRSGQIKLAGKDVAKFFEPSVEAIINAFERQRQVAATLQVQIKHAFLLGSFSASDFLYNSLLLNPVFSGVNLYRPSCQGNTAVADGGVLSYIDFTTCQTPRSSRDPG